MNGYKVAPEFEPDKLEHGRVYKFRARNFYYGVWNEQTLGFIGIREKFNSLYLFTEYHATTGGRVGTVVPQETTDHRVPEGIEIAEYLGSYCKQCDQAAEFVEDEPGARPTKGRQHHVDRALDEGHDAHGQTFLRSNKMLFSFLATLEEDSERRELYAALAEIDAIEDDEERYARQDAVWTAYKARRRASWDLETEKRVEAREEEGK